MLTRRPILTLRGQWILLFGWSLLCAPDLRAQSSGVETWSLVETPDLVLGRVDGPPEHLFTNVVGGVTLSDGSVVIALNDVNTTEFRRFSPGGAFLNSFSRKGDGPGEFRRLQAVSRLPADSVIGFDLDLGYAVFEPGGDSERVGRVPGDVLARVIGMSDRDVVVLPIPNPARGRADERLATYAVRVANLRSGAIDSIGIAPGARTVREENFFLPAPFTPTVTVASGAGWIWIGYPDQSEIMGVGPDRSRILLSVPFDREAVSRADRAAYRHEQLAGTTGDLRRRRERMLRRVTFPERKPSFDALVVDRRGRLWVRGYTSTWQDDPSTWVVIRPDGATIARLAQAADIVGRCGRREYSACAPILEIGADYILVKHINEWGVQSVRRHRISVSR